MGIAYQKEKYDSLDGKTVVSYIEDTDQPDPFTAKMNRSGMSFQGTMHYQITSEKELEEFAKFVADCWAEHKRLAPKILTTISGH